MDTAHVAGILAVAAVIALIVMRKVFASVNFSVGR